MPYHFQYDTLLLTAEYLKTLEPFTIHLIKIPFASMAKWVKATLDANRADYDGYAGKTLDDGVVEEVTGLDKPQLRYPLQTWTGPPDLDAQLIYGYYVFRSDSPNEMVLVHRFDAPIHLGSVADLCRVLPQWPVNTLPNS